MPTNRKPRVAAYPEPWSKYATASDAYYFAKREYAALLRMFHESASRGENDAMTNAVKKMRGVADKLDAFRRMKVREWAAQAANPDDGEEAQT